MSGGSVSLRRAFAAIVAVVMVGPAALAEAPMPASAQAAAKRFPQPVRVGDLIGRDVRRPVPSQQELGRVRDVVRLADGRPAMVIRYGEWLGIGGRTIAVPVDGMALLGTVVEPVGYSPAELDRFPRFDPRGAHEVPRDAEITVGLAKPAH